MARRKKITRKMKKKMFGDTYDPKASSKYARKMKAQARGVFSPTSPFRPVNEGV